MYTLAQLEGFPVSTRRSFLSTSAAAIATAVFPKYLFAQKRGIDIITSASTGAYTQGLLTQPRFHELVGSTFSANSALGKTSSLLLTTVSDAVVQGSTIPVSVSSNVGRMHSTVHPTANRQTQLTSFSAQFQVSGEPLTQDTYILDHGTLGSFSALVVPGTQSSGQQTVTVTFNYRTQGSTPLSRQQMMPPVITVFKYDH